MCGGGQQMPEQIDPLKQSEADIRVLQQQYELDRMAQQAQYEQDLANEERERGQFNEDLGGARVRTRSSIDDLFNQRGLDVGEYDDRIRAALDREQAGITFGMTPTFGSDIGSNLINDLRNEQIRGYKNAINEYAPEGFETNAFAGTADDAIIDAILAEQFGEASDSILRARDRGTLNDQGFRYAMDNLNTQKTAAGSRLQDTGGGILEGYRTQLGDIAGNARTGAGNFDFGDTFDPTHYGNLISTRQGELSGRLEGDIRNAIGGEQFFNTADLIQKGGIGQGAQNTGLGGQSGSLLAAIGNRKQEEEQQRGLGTTGSF